MKKTLRPVSLVLSVIMLALAFVSCGKEPETPKITIEIAVYNGEKGENIVVGERGFSINEGSTALDAMNELAAARGMTFTTGTDGQLVTVTYNGKTVQFSQGTLPDGTVEMKSIVWSVNGTAMAGSSVQTDTALKDKVLADGDVVSVFIETVVVTPDAN